MARFTNAEKAQECRREVGQRRYVYRRRVQDGKMKQEHADRLIAIMEEMQSEYEAAAAKDTPDLFGGGAS